MMSAGLAAMAMLALVRSPPAHQPTQTRSNGPGLRTSRPKPRPSQLQRRTQRTPRLSGGEPLEYEPPAGRTHGVAAVGIGQQLDQPGRHGVVVSRRDDEAGPAVLHRL